MLIGRYTQLRVFDSTDAHYVRTLRNSPDVAQQMQERWPISDMAQQKFIESLAESQSHLYFVAESLDSFQRFGVLSFRNIDYRNQRAESGIFVDEKARGQGPMVFEACYLLLNFGFSYLNLNKIVGEVLPHNERAIRLNRSLGFCIEGVSVRHTYYNGAFHDVLRFALFREDFRHAPAPFIKKFRELNAGDDGSCDADALAAAIRGITEDGERHRTVAEPGA